MRNRFNGFEVVLDSTLTESQWMFPERRFVEWEAKDESWARKMGWGYEKQIPSNKMTRVGDKLVMHPETFEKVKLEIIRRELGTSEIMFGNCGDTRYAYIKY